MWPLTWSMPASEPHTTQRGWPRRWMMMARLRMRAKATTASLPTYSPGLRSSRTGHAGEKMRVKRVRTGRGAQSGAQSVKGEGTTPRQRTVGLKGHVVLDKRGKVFAVHLDKSGHLGAHLPVVALVALQLVAHRAAGRRGGVEVVCEDGARVE